MGSTWLTCCSREGYAWLLAEVRSRDSRANVLRFGGVGDLPLMIGEFPGQDLNAAFVLEAGDEDVLAAVEAIARCGRASQILVLADSQDPALFARLFYAGATEVIAAGPLAASSNQSNGACAERGPEDAAAAVRPACNNEVPPESIEERSRAAGPGLVTAREHFGTPESSSVSAAGAAEEGTPAAKVGTESVPPRPTPGHRSQAAAMGMDGRDFRGRSEAGSSAGAPLVAVISGRGGVGKSTLVASLACCSARMGLRAAVIDADLMFGNQHELLGVDSPIDLGVLLDEKASASPEAAAEATAMKVAPGLTLWGPLETPETAEVMAVPVDGLVRVLRAAADVIFVDTSTFWGDCVASLVASCDRCLVVGVPGVSSVSSSVKAMRLASRVGVPGTKMTGVLNRFGGEGAGEEQAMRYEMGVALRSRARIADGGDEVRGMVAFGHLDSLLLGPGAFATSVRSFARDLLRELGCPVEADEAGARRSMEDRPCIRLPWKKRVGDAA